MATKRESKKLITEVNRENAEDAFAKYNDCISKLEVQQGKMNQELTAIKEKYEPGISKLQEQKDGHFEVLQAYAEANPEMFADKKSLEFTHGNIGFRTGNPKLVTRKGFKWPAVFELVKEKLGRYIRKKEEVDKEGLLADRKALGEAKLKEVGLEVAQDESFYVDPKLEEVAYS
ncbi:MAG: host-nuclease inhibitor Gam family protein [Bacteroidota bacterium]